MINGTKIGTAPMFKTQSEQSAAVSTKQRGGGGGAEEKEKGARNAKMCIPTAYTEGCGLLIS